MISSLLSLSPHLAFQAAIVKRKAAESAFVKIWEAVGLCHPGTHVHYYCRLKYTPTKYHI